MCKVVLEINNLTKYYGKVKGIENLSLSLNEGEIFGLIGPNGAGKSTTIRAILNLINKTSGIVYINGKEFNKDDIETKKLIGYLPSEVSLYEDLTVKEMIDYHESYYTTSKNRRSELIKILKLDETKKIEDLSFGNLKKLGIVLAFLHEPKILILDEPTSGLDPIMQQEFYKLLLEEKKKNTTIIYSTHILSEVSKICDRVGIIREGKLIKVENIEELCNKNMGYITIMSNDIDKIIKDFAIKPDIIDKKTIKFPNNFEYNDLIKKLSKYNISKLLIEDMNLEDVLLQYYN
ncbi:MAG: ABC transporter ATP-binding protein [bacterium]|nr:ABC transporter ATP-binding protein [bacterium]MDY4108042.1 ABC transporter ATP-binding protein [Bacilli bacterium]